MTTPEQIAFIRQQLSAGVGRADIAKVLSGTGWALPDIDEAFAHVMPMTVIPPTSPAAETSAAVSNTPTSPAVIAPALIAQTGTKHLGVWIIVAGVLIVMIGSLVAYAYLEKIGPFGHAPYEQDNLLSGLLSRSGEITTSSYAVSASLDVVPRDGDAAPFTLQVPNDAARVEQYKNDATRASEIRDLLSVLALQRTPYPTSLQQVIANGDTANRGFILTDPVSGVPYKYVVTEGGKNFALTATFDTKAAISAIKQNPFGFSTTTTLINGQTVAFTKDSSVYLQLSPEPPKPFLEQLGLMMQSLPSAMSLTSSVVATNDWSKAGAADWKFNVDATGDFGDLTFKVDADALKKDKDYYFRINNIPSILGDFTSIKGQWIKVSPASSTLASDSGNEFGFIAAELPQFEQQYKKNRAEALVSIRKIVAFADEEHLLTFKSAPRREKVNGQVLYRYDVGFNKAAILPFYEKAAAEANTNADLHDSGFFDNPGTIDYLKSDEFSETFDYYDKNTTMTLWVDPAGFPAIVSYSIRIVPPDTATALLKKQINVVWKLVLSDINKPVNIVAPEGAKPIEDLLHAGDNIFGLSLGAARVKSSDAAIESDLNTIATIAEIYYGDIGKNSYGTQKWASGAATLCTDGMFTDTNIKKALTGVVAAQGVGKNVACYANGQSYIIGADLASSGWWCIDSLGTAKAETGSLPTLEPKSKVCP